MFAGSVARDGTRGDWWRTRDVRGR